VDDDAAVVHRRGGQEDGHQQLVAQASVEPMPGGDEVAQAGIAFENHERADAAFGHVRGGADNFFDILLNDVVGLVKGAFPYLGEGAADVCLKEDDNHDQDRTKEGFEEPMQGLEFELACEKIDDNNESYADQHLDSPGAADEQHDPVNDERDDQDIDDIQQSHRLKGVKHAKRSVGKPADVWSCI